MLLQPLKSSLQPVLPLDPLLKQKDWHWLPPPRSSSPLGTIFLFFKMWIGTAHSHLSSNMVSDWFSKAACNSPLSSQLIPAAALHGIRFPAIPHTVLYSATNLNTNGVSFFHPFFKTKKFHWLSSPLGLQHYIKINLCLDQRPDSTLEAPEDDSPLTGLQEFVFEVH